MTGACADLLAACKAEDTYGLKKDYTEGGFASGSLTLFSSPNYDFKFLVGAGEALVFRRGLGEEYAGAANERRGNTSPDEEEKRAYRDVRASVADTWGEPRLQLREAQGTHALPTDEFGPAAAATMAGEPLVAYTEITNAETGLRAVVEYPVKTMNVSAEGYPDADAMEGRGAVW